MRFLGAVWLLVGCCCWCALLGYVSADVGTHVCYVENFDKIQLIRNYPLHLLTRREEIEKLIYAVGLNDEQSWELPQEVLDASGGLRVYQYPNQFAGYLQLLSGLEIVTYLEVGCRWGGTFILTTEYLQRFSSVPVSSIAVDLSKSPPARAYSMCREKSYFVHMNSQSLDFAEMIRSLGFVDLILIDGDHSYAGAKRDFDVVKEFGRVIVFHDITNDASPGVRQVWREVRNSDEFETHEFIDQYREVQDRLRAYEAGEELFGIGVAISKRYRLRRGDPFDIDLVENNA
jgi:cephalosporin hydroxylase